MSIAALSSCAYVARQATVASLKISALTSPKEIAIGLNRSFIERYRNLVTIDASFVVDVATSMPSGNAFDGDLHIAGRSPQVGLPIVVEIANAASEQEAMDIVHRAQGTGKPLEVSGVWRIWPEHPGAREELQGKPLDRLDTTYPDHVFEIHPATRIQNVALLRSFRSVKGYRPGSARTTLESFEKATATLEITSQTITVITQTNLFNDVHFLMEIAADRQVVVPDGRFLWASARELNGDLVVERLRMVFAKGTPPELAVRGLTRGARLHVWGLPRIDYAEIARRALRDRPRLTGPLPYEIVVLGIYEEEQ